jgi:hypothetical protein
MSINPHGIRKNSSYKTKHNDMPHEPKQQATNKQQNTQPITKLPGKNKHNIQKQNNNFTERNFYLR